MRNIIHDNPDDKAVALLKHTIDVLGPSSVILIDDMVVPNKGARWETTQLDLFMMTGLASLERTYDQWYELAAKAGLKIVNMYCYTTSLQDHIIECIPV
jgi:demethylsterigmatocystin 6-O-methyltransferase